MLTHNRGAVQQVSVADALRLQREAIICAAIAFPIMLIAAVGLDLAFVIVSFYPNMAFFLRLEGVMPAYLAYRILVEVVLEAVPQVRTMRRMNSAGPTRQRRALGAVWLYYGLELRFSVACRRSCKSTHCCSSPTAACARSRVAVSARQSRAGVPATHSPTGPARPR